MRRPYPDHAGSDTVDAWTTWTRGQRGRVDNVDIRGGLADVLPRTDTCAAVGQLGVNLKTPRPFLFLKWLAVASVLERSSSIRVLCELGKEVQGKSPMGNHAIF